MPPKKSKRAAADSELDFDSDSEFGMNDYSDDDDSELMPQKGKAKKGKAAPKRKNKHESDDDDESEIIPKKGKGKGDDQEQKNEVDEQGDDDDDDDDYNYEDGLDSIDRELLTLGDSEVKSASSRRNKSQDRGYDAVIKSVTKSANRLSSAARAGSSNSQSALLASASLAAAASAALAAAAAGSTNPQSISRALGSSAEIRSPNVAGVDRADELNKKANFAPNLPSARRSSSTQSAAMILTSTMRREKEQKEAVKETLASASQAARLDLFDDDFDQAVRSSSRRRYETISASSKRNDEQPTLPAQDAPEDPEVPDVPAVPEAVEAPASASASAARVPTSAARAPASSSFLRSSSRRVGQGKIPISTSSSTSVPALTHEEIMNLTPEELRNRFKDKDGNFDVDAYQQMISTQRYPFLKLLRAGYMESPTVRSEVRESLSPMKSSTSTITSNGAYSVSSIARSPYPTDATIQKQLDQADGSMSALSSSSASTLRI